MRAFRVTVPAADEDLAVALLWEAGTLGLQVTAAAGDAVLLAYFPGGAATAESILVALDSLPVARIEDAAVPEVDWVARFREGFRAFHAGSFRIVPAWAAGDPGDGRRLVVDPGQAFGTGTHESTRLSLAALEALCAARRPRRVLDVGTGSGILAIAARLLGARVAVGVEIDADALPAAREHAALNDVDVHLVRGDGARGVRAGAFDLVLANIAAPLLIERARELARGLPPRGRPRARRHPAGPGRGRARRLCALRRLHRGPHRRRVGRARVAEGVLILARFHVPGAAPGARIALPEHTAHHARDVLRLRAGAAVRVFDGHGAEFDAILEVVTRQGVSGRITGAAVPRPESPLRVTLAMSPLKGDRMELAIQKATELGVAEIRPVVTVRTDAAARPALKGARQDRWEKVASGAAEQCGRATVPVVAPTVTLAEFMADPPAGTRLVLLERDEGQPALATLPRPDAVTVLIGPAGGWEASEIRRLADAGFQPVSLGPRILRAETAAIAALTAVQVLWGDL